MESTAFGTLMPLLDAAQSHPVITAKACQLIAELAKAGQQLISALGGWGAGRRCVRKIINFKKTLSVQDRKMMKEYCQYNCKAGIL